MTENETRQRVHVAVGVIRGHNGTILVSRRAAGQHLGGLWEFPGGKLENGETVEAALHRELLEELGIQVKTQSPLMQIRHDYPNKSVLLDVRTVAKFDNEPVAREGQPLRWLKPQELKSEDFPEANRAIIRCLQLPDHLAVHQANPETDTATNLSSMMAFLPPDTLLRLRRTRNSKNVSAGYHELVIRTLEYCRHAGVGLIVDLELPQHEEPALIELISAGDPALRGCHINSQLLTTLHSRPVPDHLLLGVSCHSAAELGKATQVGADYALLSPVLPTPSHPQASVLGWHGLRHFLKECELPVYAMGGMRRCDLAMAQAAGARGIAGISAFQTH